jgi:integrase
MGYLFRPKYPPKGQTYARAQAAGTLIESRIWWIQYQQNFKTIRQSAKTTSRQEAERILKRQEGAVLEGRPVNPAADRLKVRELAEAIQQDYEIQERKSRSTLGYRLAHLLEAFGHRRMATLTTADVEGYKHARLRVAAPATVNRELAALSRMFSLSRKRGLLTAPEIEYLEERNARKGFFETEQFEAVCRHLPEHLRPVAGVARITGWRKSELRSRQWRHVEFTGVGWLRLEPGETKNDEGRMFPLIPELRVILEAQRARADALQRARGRIVPWIFFRPDGRPVGDFKRAWTTACRRAGLPGRLFHDFRRTAVRNLIRAGIPETVAMKMTGHLTNAVFKRYAIVDEGMLREAGDKLAASARSQVRSQVAQIPGRGAILSS